MDMLNNVPADKDIYVFSLQECLKPAKSVKAVAAFLKNQEYTILTKSIGCSWKLVGYHGSITAIVAVRTSLLYTFNPISNSTVYEGFNLGFTRLGNKGSAAVSIRLPNYTLLVIANHYSSDLKVHVRRIHHV